MAKAKAESVSFFFPAYFDEKSIPALAREFYSALEKTRQRAFPAAWNLRPIWANLRCLRQVRRLVQMANSYV